MSYNDDRFFVATSSFSGSFASSTLATDLAVWIEREFGAAKYVRGRGFVVVGVLVTTTGIILLVLGLVGASIEAYSQLLTAIVQQQLSSISEQLPSILRPAVEQPSPDDSDPPFSSADILEKLVGNLIGTPLWLALAVAGIVLIYSGLYLAQRQVPGRRIRGR